MDILFVMIAVCGVAGGIGGGFAIARRQPARPETRAAGETRSEIAGGYGERFRMVRQWQDALAHFHAQLTKVLSVEEMVKACTSAVQNEFADVSIVVAIGPIKDIMLLQTLASVDVTHVELNGMSCVHSSPEIEASLANELMQEIYQVVKRLRTANKGWWMLKDASPMLQSRLQSRFHLAGNGVILPLFCGDILCGAMLIASNHLTKNLDAVQDTTSFAVMAAEVMTTWVRCMAPQILAGTAADPIAVTPLHSIASLSVLEQAASTFQVRDDADEILSELMQYSQSIMTPAAEISLLASQTCSSLRRICQGSFAMFLRSAGPDTAGKFVVEAIETDNWSWSRYQGMQGEGAMPYEDSVLDNWPDRFVRDSCDQGRVIALQRPEDIAIAANRLSHLELQSLAIIPAQIRGHNAALLAVGRKQPGGIPNQPLMVARSVAALAAMGLAAMHLMHQEQHVRQSLESVWKLAAKVTAQGITALTNVVKRHSVVTLTNPEQVAHYAEAIALQMRLSPNEVSQVRLAALLCDIGTVVIPSSLLRKEGGLTGDEWRLIQSHPAMSAEILEAMDVVRGSLPIVRHHHERYDGSGYPAQLSKDKIPQGARILAVADTFVNLQINRPHRAALARKEALAIIQEEAGKQLDPAVVVALAKVTKQEDDTQVAA